MSLRAFSLAVALVSVTLACHRAPVTVEGGGCPTSGAPTGDQIRTAHRRFPSADTTHAWLVAHMESSYPTMGQLSDAYIVLTHVAQPEAASMMSRDTLHPGTFTYPKLAPGLYAVLARRVGFRQVVDTVRLEAGWIDSATYHTVADVVCLFSSPSGSRPSARY